MVTPAYHTAGATEPTRCRTSVCGSPALASTPLISTKTSSWGAVTQKPGLNGLLEVIQPGDTLLLTALDRLGRDTLGLFR